MAHSRLRNARSELGATAVEYALMVAFIALVIIAAVVLIGPSLATIFTDAGTQI